MPTLKYLGIFEGGFRSGFVTSPNTLQQGKSKLLGLLIDWENSGQDVSLTYKVGFHSNTFLNGSLNPNTLIQSGGDDYISAVQVNVTRAGFFSFLSAAPTLTIQAQDGNGNLLMASNGQTIRSENGFVSLSINLA